MSEPTVPIDYIVYCGDPRLDVMTKKFTFDDFAPASACIKYGAELPLAPDLADIMGTLCSALKDRHNHKVQLSYPWKCIVCHKPSTCLVYNSINKLFDRTGLDLPDFKPSVVDIAAPVCFGGGECSEMATSITQSNDCIQRWAGLDFSGGMKIAAPPLCDFCGKGTGYKLCAGCNTTGYCSKECQAKRWSVHKKDCRRVQKEREGATAVASTSSSASTIAGKEV
ncbi:hypothetical protein IFR05_007918 [Cadophora sp. M221]|nr:hypothetical protein IFR05_007918 [Cadophora sp. M221]